MKKRKPSSCETKCIAVISKIIAYGIINDYGNYVSDNKGFINNTLPPRPPPPSDRLRQENVLTITTLYVIMYSIYWSNPLASLLQAQGDFPLILFLLYFAGGSVCWWRMSETGDLTNLFYDDGG